MATRVKLKDIELKPYLSTGTNVAYAISVERITAYSDKETFFIDFHISCGDAPTLNINGLGTKNITVGGVNVSTGQLSAYSGYFIKYNSSLNKFAVIGGGGGGSMTCADVKYCIENFTDLDLSGLDELILGGPSTDIYINGSTIHYDSVTENWTGDSEINLDENASITNNLDGTVNNNYGDTYEENNDYEPGSTINNTGEITNNYEDYTENNNYSSDSVINHNGGIHNYDEDTEINIGGDANIENLTVNNLTMNGGGFIINIATDHDDQIYNGIDLTWVLSSVPFSEDVVHITTDSGTNLILGVDYLVINDTIAWLIPPNTGEHLYVSWIKASGDTYGIIPITMTTNSHNAVSGEYIVVTYSAGNSTINLPDASVNNGSVVKVKKFTGEDIRVITILPYGADLIDGYTGATMNINRTMYTFTAINGNWYLGD